jgi:hypothetical protein
MKSIQEWIDNKLKEIEVKLPVLIHKDPASFACGYNAGYKCALLDIERFLFKEEAK